MEYNSPLVGISDGLVPSLRALEEKTPYVPCESVGDEYKKSCYFELGGWLHAVFPGGYEKTEEFCVGAPDGYGAYCALGFGASVPPSLGYDMLKSRMVCDVFKGEIRTAGYAGVSWGFYTDPVHRENTLAACEMEDAAETSRCLILADLTEGLGSFPQ